MPLPLLHQLLLLGLLVAASHGDPSGDHTYDTSMCLLPQNFTCRGVNISYPFYLSNQSRVLDGYGGGRTSCGYPGFGILCDDDKGPILQLDETESVVIRSIEREVANVSLADPDVLDAGSSCPRVDHNVTLPQASWLSIPDGAVDYLVFFLNCSFTTGFSRPPGIYLTTCLGPIDTPSFVLPEDAVPPGNSWSQVCRVIRVPVLKYDPNAYVNGWGTDGYAKLVHQGFKLAWNITQPCTRCEQSEGRCGYNESAVFSGCLCPDGRVRSDICNLIGVAHSKKIICKK